MTVPVSDLQAIAPSAVIELYELQLNAIQHGVTDVYRFHAGTSLNNNGEVVWAGNSYQRFPVEADGFEYTGNGQLPRPKIRVSNILGTITALLLSLPNGLDGAKVTRIRTLARYLDAVNFPGGVNPYGTPDPTAELPREIYYVDRKTTETREAVEFELAAAFDLQNIKAPKRQTIQNICQWRYRTWNAATSSFDYTNVDCPYVSVNYFTEDNVTTGDPALDVCSKRLSSCETRFGSVTLNGTVSVGSPTLTVASTAQFGRIEIGDEIRGAGLPTGTTVAAKSGSTITLSQNSIATTTVSATGTVGSGGSTITMTSVSGIIPGMLVSGTYVPSGARVVSVNTATRVVTLSISNNSQFRTSVVTKTGTYNPSLTAFLVGDTSGIQVGDYVSGSNFYSATRVLSITPSGLLSAVNLSKKQPYDTLTSVTVTFYRQVTPTAQTYTFTASDEYIVRPDGSLPFGSFPGVGGYR